MKNLVIFASGNGSNAENLIRFFQDRKTAAVTHLISNNQSAGVLSKAVNLSVPTLILNRKELFEEEGLVSFLRKQKTDLIILAGFLWALPPNLVKAFEGKIINLHPSLLPKFGGKGMYGKKVHQAVLSAGEKESGITIHLVNEKLDEGAILFQTKIALKNGETLESLTEKISQLELHHFPLVVEDLLSK